MGGASTCDGGAVLHEPDTHEAGADCDPTHYGDHDDSDEECLTEEEEFGEGEEEDEFGEGEEEDDNDDSVSVVTMETSTTSAAMGSVRIRKSDRKRWRRVQRLREKKEAAAAAEGKALTNGLGQDGEKEKKKERASQLVQSRVSGVAYVWGGCGRYVWGGCGRYVWGGCGRYVRGGCGRYVRGGCGRF